MAFIEVHRVSPEFSGVAVTVDVKLNANRVLPLFRQDCPSRPAGDQQQMLCGLLGWDILELFFRIHLGLGGVKDRLLGNNASLDLRA